MSCIIVAITDTPVVVSPQQPVEPEGGVSGHEAGPDDPEHRPAGLDYTIVIVATVVPAVVMIGLIIIVAIIVKQ